MNFARDKRLCALCLWFLLLIFRPAGAAPDLMIVGEYNGQKIDGWVMSEKLDGVRAYWDGQTLYSRSGRAFAPPASFLENFPDFALDGELWSKRGDFENISATVRADGRSWDEIKLHVFDVPDAAGDLWQRLDVLRDFLKRRPAAHIAVIEQIPIQNHKHMREFLRRIDAEGGEGIVLRDPGAAYEKGPSQSILKLKSRDDDECTVRGYTPGKGKYLGMVGALICENRHGTFKIGSGLKDADRKNPPAVGSTISYRHRGFTKNGKPRFASFLRRR